MDEPSTIPGFLEIKTTPVPLRAEADEHKPAREPFVGTIFVLLAIAAVAFLAVKLWV